MKTLFRSWIVRLALAGAVLSASATLYVLWLQLNAPAGSQDIFTAVLTALVIQVALPITHAFYPDPFHPPKLNTVLVVALFANALIGALLGGSIGVAISSTPKARA